MALNTTYDPAEPVPSLLEKARFLARIRDLMASASDKLQASQARYKADFDWCVRPLRSPVEGHLVYLQREGMGEHVETGLRRRHNLQCKAIGPYRIAAEREHTVVIDRCRVRETVPRDRISLAPPDPDVPALTLTPQLDNTELCDGPPEASGNESELPLAHPGRPPNLGRQPQQPAANFLSTVLCISMRRTS